jgi:hypothetical protein
MEHNGNLNCQMRNKLEKLFQDTKEKLKEWKQSEKGDIRYQLLDLMSHIWNAFRTRHNKCREVTIRGIVKENYKWRKNLNLRGGIIKMAKICQGKVLNFNDFSALKAGSSRETDSLWKKRV